MIYPVKKINACILLVVSAFAYQPNLTATVKDQIEGAVMGAALGDALGRVTEFLFTTDQIKKRYPLGLKSFKDFHSLDWVELNEKNIAAYTDDTVMAKIVMRECIDYASSIGRSDDHIDLNSLTFDDPFAGSIFFDKLGRAFSRLFTTDEDPLFSIRAHGPTNIKNCQRLAKKQSRSPLWWQDSNEVRVNKADIMKEGGCGSVMRAWPIGIVFAYNDGLMKKLAHDQCNFTHRHPAAQAACVALVAGIAEIIKNKQIDPSKVVERMIIEAEQYELSELEYKPAAVRAQTVGNLKDAGKTLLKNDALFTSTMLRWVALSYMEEPAKILGTRNKKGANHRSEDGVLLGWAADEALAAAVYVFLRHPDDLAAALEEACNTPGDSDSIATLAGALVGARTGWARYKNTSLDDDRLEGKKELLAQAAEADAVLDIIKTLSVHWSNWIL
jgi:ADP-ribosylglycohydrolase